MRKYSRDSESAKMGHLAEMEVKKFLEGLGFLVEIVSSSDDDGNETYQHYVYLDGRKYPHPDFIVTKKGKTAYVEVKSRTIGYTVPFSNKDFDEGHKYLLIQKYHFDSYLQLSRWKEIPTVIFFIVASEDLWLSIDIESLEKTKRLVYNPYNIAGGEWFCVWDKEDFKDKVVVHRGK